MTHVVDFVPAAAFSLEALADLFARSFAEYFYPANVTAADMAWRVRVENIDLWHSVVLVVGGEPAGLALLALRPGRAWCGGFGVTLPHRGRGLSHRLITALIERAREAQAPLLTLEVLSRNERAIATYTRAGLRITRDLLIVEWRRPEGEPAAPAPTGVVEAEAATLLHHFHALHPVQAAWQRDLPSLLMRGPLAGFALGNPAAPAAYALVQPQAAGAARIVDLAAREAETAGQVLAALQARFTRLSSINEPSDAPHMPALAAAGFAEVDRQHDMEIVLSERA
ncbi:MAG TPA: GNAT family N-acetyltransferase [Roseiflexaceae bacterium]|nr:GNAT family N-acetyltransferase [Roseiflexaceae bacterium]